MRKEAERRDKKEVSREGKRLNELTEDEMEKYIPYNTKMDKWKGHPNENEIIGELHGKPILLPKKREEKQEWKKSIGATLEEEHLDFLLIISDRLQGVLKKTNHSNRDTMKLRRIIDELDKIIEANKKVD